MNTDNKQLPIKREDYESMLQHAVAVIENARLEIAKHINGSYNIVVFLTICISYANNCFTL